MLQDDIVRFMEKAGELLERTKDKETEEDKNSFVNKSHMLLIALVAGVIALIAPAIVFIYAIYNSPFAILFPKVSDSQTAYEYVDELYDELESRIYHMVNDEEAKKGYDVVERTGMRNIKRYRDDIVAVYMIKYGYGEMAAEMNFISKRRLKSVFEDMVRISVYEYDIKYLRTREVEVEVDEPGIEEKENDSNGHNDLISLGNEESADTNTVQEKKQVVTEEYWEIEKHKEVSVILWDYKVADRMYEFSTEKHNDLMELINLIKK